MGLGLCFHDPFKCMQVVTFPGFLMAHEIAFALLCHLKCSRPYYILKADFTKATFLYFALKVTWQPLCTYYVGCLL